MSRAFVNEDAAQEPEPRYTLPERDSPQYAAAAARALVEGANLGDTRSAERATGYGWGDPELSSHIRALIAEAEAVGDDRTVRLGRRYLKKADVVG